MKTQLCCLCRLFEHFHHSHGVAGLGHLLHQLLRLLELVQQLVNVRRGGAAALGYAATSATIENLRSLTLLLGHGSDDGFDAVDTAVV